MNKDPLKNEEKLEKAKEMVDEYYKKAMRAVEYYVLLCFILITFIPLLNFSWVQGFIRFIYLTGFPLLIILFVVSMFKDSLINFIAGIVSK